MRKTVLITGSSHGIGRALAIAFARRGYDVGVNGNKNVAMAQEVAEEVRACGARAEVYACDVADSAAVEEMMNCVHPRLRAHRRAHQQRGRRAEDARWRI